MSEHFENMRRLLDRMDASLTPGKDSDSEMLDYVNHLRNLLELAQTETQSGGLTFNRLPNKLTTSEVSK